MKLKSLFNNLNESETSSKFANFFELVKHRILREVNEAEEQEEFQLVNEKEFIANLEKVLDKIENELVPKRSTLNKIEIEKNEPGNVSIICFFNNGTCDVKVRISISTELGSIYLDIDSAIFIKEKYLSKRYLGLVGDYEAKTTISDDNRYENTVMLVNRFFSFSYSLISLKHLKAATITLGEFFDTAIDRLEKRIRDKISFEKDVLEKFNLWYFDLTGELGNDVKLCRTYVEGEHIWTLDIGAFKINTSANEYSSTLPSS